MSKRTAFSLLAFLLLGTVALADDSAPLLTLEDVELAPLPEVRWELLHLEHRALFERLEILHHTRQELEEQLAESKDNGWTQARIQALDAEWDNVAREALALLLEAGADRKALMRLKGTPGGPLRAERCAHAVVLDVVEGKTRRGALMVRLVRALDAAQLAVHHQREIVETRLTQAGVQEAQRESILSSFEERVWLMERRFWRIVDYVLPAEQKRAIRRALPRPLNTWEDPLDHGLHLPGLTLGQAGRLRALEKEIESAIAPDEAQERALSRKLEDESLPEDVRRDLENQLHRANLRMARMHHQAFERGRELLTEAQMDAFLAIPPRVSVEDRIQRPEDLFGGLALKGDAVRRLAGIMRRYDALEQRFEREERALEAEREAAGPDSPQMQRMEMMEAGVTARVIESVRGLVAEVLLDVLAPGQVVSWMLAPSGDD